MVKNRFSSGWGLICAVLCTFLVAVNASAQESQLRGVAENGGQGKRIALVIGNSSYKDSPLKNPVNDARDMAATLRKLGFDVIEKTDASQKDMNRAIAQFGEKLRSDTVALFFYAGHGMQVRGKNYIIPVDAQVTSEASARVETVDVDSVMDQLAVSPMNIVILDACRNNPFERRFRSPGGGLAQMDAPKGSLIAYATAPGKTAADGSGRNGLYTQELLKSIQTPGLTLEAVFKRVRNGVMAASGETQTPWESSSLTGDFYFTSPKVVPVPVATSLTPPALTATRQSGSDPAPIEVMLWENVKTATTVGELQAYLNRYPTGFFADVAKARIAGMNGGAKEKAMPDGNKKAAAERAEGQAAQNTSVSTPAPSLVTPPQVADKSTEPISATLAHTERQPGKVIGTLVTKDSLTGNTTSSVEVKIVEAGGDKTVYSSGDAIGRDGSVLQVRVGDVVLKKLSGALWSLPLKAGNSGEAKVWRDNETDMTGTISWKTQSTKTGQIQIVADIVYWIPLGYTGSTRGTASGKWTADYGSHALPESTVAVIRGVSSNPVNLVDTKFFLLSIGTAPEPALSLVNAPQVADKSPEPISATAAPTERQPGKVIGTLVTKDSLTGNTTSSDEVKIIEAGVDKTVYSSGDVIGKDGAVLQVRVGEVVFKKLSGTLWSFPLKAGTSGEAKVWHDNQLKLTGTIQWKAQSTAEGSIEIVADIVYTVHAGNYSNLYVNSAAGKWTAKYSRERTLSDSTDAKIRSNISSQNNMVSTKFTFLTAGAALAAPLH